MKRILLLLSVLSFMHWGTHAQNCNDPVFSINEGFTLDQDVDGFFAEVLPDCWSRAYPQGANDQEGRIRRNSDGSNAFLQVASGNGSGGDNGIALMPEPANYLGQLSFRAKTSSGSALFDVELVLYSGGTNVRFLRSFSLNRNWQDFNVDLGNLLDGFVATGNEVSLGFRHTDANKSFTYSMDIDDVVYTSGCPTDPAAVARTQNITVELDETGNATITPEDIDNGSTDECGDPIASLALDITSFDCSNLGDNTVTLTATTAGGEVDTETAIVRVLPDLPVLNDSIDVYLDEMGSVSIAVEDFTTADACTGVTYTFGSATQTTFVCEVVNRRFTVDIITSFGSGDSETRSIYVFPRDTISPAVLGQDISIEIGSAGVATISPADVDNGSSDNCELTLRLSKSSFSFDDEGVNPVWLIGTDSGGNIDSAEVNITVESGITAFNLSTAATGSQCLDGTTSFDLTLDGSETGLEYILKDTLDGRVVDGPITGTGSPLSFSTGNLAQTTTFQAFAQTPPASGNAFRLGGTINDFASTGSQWSFDYTQGYTLEFVFNGNTDPSNFYNTIFSLGSEFVNGNATINDLEVYFQQGTRSLIVGHGRGQSNFQYSQFASPASATQVHIAIVFDPSASDPQDILKVYFDGVAQTNLNTNSFITSMSRSDRSSWYIGLNKHQDFSGLTAVCNGTFDEVRIWNNGRSVEEINSTKTGCVETNTEGLAHYYRFETGSGFIISDETGNGLDLDILSVTGNPDASFWTDGLVSCLSDNQIPMANTVTIGDLDAPTLDVVESFALNLDDSGTATLDLAGLVTSAADNCSDSSALVFAANKLQFTCTDLGVNMVTITVQDEAGNVTSAQVSGTVSDATAPTILPNNQSAGSTLPPLEFALDAATNQVEITFSDLRSTVEDNCDENPTVTISSSVFTCRELGSQLITITAVDSEENQSIATEEIIIVDRTVPTFTILNPTVELDANGSYAIQQSDILAELADNCSSLEEIIVSFDDSPFTCTSLGTSDFSFTVTDVNENVATAVSSVTVVDRIAPVVVTQDLTVELDESGSVTIDPLQIDNGSSDNCSFTLSLDQTTFTTADVGNNTVTLTALDGGGNSTTGTAIVTVEMSKTPQTITFPQPNDGVYGDGPVTLNATASSGLSVTYAVLSGPGAIINGNQVEINGAGDIIL